MSDEFELGGHKYRYSKIDARRQAHVARRLVPVVSSLADLTKVDGLSDLAALAPVAKAVASMPDADFDYVLDVCLSVTQREQAGGTGWAPIWSEGAKQIMFSDIDLAVMMQIVAKVIQGNLGNFFPGNLPGSIAAASPAP